MNWRISSLLLTLLFLAGCSSAMPAVTSPAAGLWREDCNLDMLNIAQAVEKYRVKTGCFPQRLGLLVIGPDHWPDLWEPLLPATVSLEDPWGFPYRLIVFDPSRTTMTGLDFQIISAGPDHQFYTSDDLLQPEPVSLTAPEPSAPVPALRPAE